MRINPNNIDRVLVIGLTCIGDMLLSSAALWNLRRFLPHAHFTVWAGSAVVTVFKNDPLWDEVVPYDRGRMYPGVRGRLRMIAEVRRGGYDLIIDLRSTLVPLVSRAKYAPLWGVREFFLPQKLHEAERNLQVMASLGVPLFTRQLRFFVPEEDKMWVSDELLPRIGKKKFVVLNPGTRGNERQWPFEKFLKLGKIFSDSEMCVLGVIGYLEEQQRMGKELLMVVGESGIDLTGKISLSRLAAILSRTDLFVSNDGGPLHVASAVGTPTVGIFLPENSMRYAPWQNVHRIVTPPDLARNRDKGRYLLSDIAVEGVLKACREILEF